VSTDSFSELLGRVRAGDEEAAAVIFRRFVDRLAVLAHLHLHPSVCRTTDADDIVQSVYRTFFRRVREGEFQLEHWGGLWGLLARITVRKCARVSRDENWQREALANLADASDSKLELNWQALAREPSPAEAAALNDTLQSLLDPLRESHRRIVRMALEGYTQGEIAGQVGCSERTVGRVLGQAQADLRKIDRREA
jgi:RNA polymerase sigma-70 factor, ECF subfamily